MSKPQAVAKANQFAGSGMYCVLRDLAIHPTCEKSQAASMSTKAPTNTPSDTVDAHLPGCLKKGVTCVEHTFNVSETLRQANPIT